MPTIEMIGIRTEFGEGEDNVSESSPMFQINDKLSVEGHLSTSETGIFNALVLNPEGRDHNANHQDAAHTHDDGRMSESSLADYRKQEEALNQVLIIEDTLELAEVMQATLHKMGFSAHIATNGKTGMQMIREGMPGLLFMDLGLPDTTGWKIIEELKALYEANNVPLPKIVVVTAYGDAANRVIGKLQNIHSYLIKPVTPAQLEQTVHEVLSA
ncbi:MAG: response regulator [Anaerolineaceae bacterium]|nr:response regulator [Anaerolineaceae bacterium]